MKKLLVAIFVLSFFTNLNSQVYGDDCFEATNICDSIYSLAFLSPLDTAASANEINSNFSCLANGEVKGIWYRFAADGPGYLRFNIIPNDTTMDFDWALFHLGWGDTCSNIFSVPSLEVSCDYSGIGGGFYTTGMNGLTQQGQQPAYYIADPVLFYLYITTSITDTADSAGYTIDFTAADFNLSTCAEIGIEESSDVVLQVYPNPTLDMITISSPFEISQYMIDDINGKRVMTGSFLGKQTNINLSSLQPGMYILTSITDKGIYRNRLIKQ